MPLTILNVIYVLVAIAMIGFILVQRGAGAQAGSGFGGGASGTVFGSRGAGNFLTKSTGVLAALFFVLSLAMGMYISRGGAVQTATELGVMEGVTDPAAPAVPGDVPAIPGAAPAVAPAGDVPSAPAPPQAGAAPVKAAPAADLPAAPATAAPATEEEDDQQPRQ